MILCIDNGMLNVKIDSFGSEIKSIKRDSREFIWSSDPNIWTSSSPIMFPICGMLKNNEYTYNGKKYTLQKHGFIRGSEFEIVEKSQNKITLKLIKTESMKDSYPFEFDFFTSFEVKDNKLICIYNVVNLSDTQTMYFNTGAHEGYALQDGPLEDYYIEFEKDEPIIRHFADTGIFSGETAVLGNGKLELNDAYFERDAIFLKNILSRYVILKSKLNNTNVKITFDVNNLGIWKKVGAPYICIEPWDGLGDDENTNGILKEKESILTLLPKESYTSKHTIEII